jgi:hypothetical protein
MVGTSARVTRQARTPTTREPRILQVWIAMPSELIMDGVLRLGLFVVALSGIAGILLSAGGLLLAVGLGGTDALASGYWILFVTLILALVAVWGTASKRTWGPLFAAASSGAWVVLSALNIAAWVAAAFAVAAVLALVLAVGLWRTPPSER